MLIFRRIFLSKYWWQKSDISDEKCASYMFNVYKIQLSRQTGSRNLTGPKNATHNMAYLYEACDQISDFIHIEHIWFYTHWTYMMHIFRHIFLSNYWWHKSDIWSQASYRYPISWEAFLDPSDSYFLFADFVDFYTHWTYMLIFRRIYGQTDRGKTVYPPPPPGSGGIKINPRVNITWGSQYHDTPAYPKSRVNMSWVLLIIMMSTGPCSKI
jgi:hypothetical protein